MGPKAAARALMLGLARAGGAAKVTPLGRNARVDDIADAIARLASDRAAFVTSAVLNVAGGYFGTR